MGDTDVTWNALTTGDSPRRTIASLFLLPACDMSCSFCGSDAEFDCLSADDATRLVHAIADAGFESLVLGGGEPLLWPHDVRALAGQAHNLGLFVQLCTNATQLTDDLITSHAIQRFILPLEGATATSHDSAREYSSMSHHALVTAKLERLRKLGREVTFSTVVTRDNAHDLATIADRIGDYLARGGHVHGWHLYRFQPIGRRGTTAALALNDVDWSASLDRVRRDSLPFRTWVRPDMLNSKTVSFVWQAGGRICTHGWPDSLPALA